MPLRDKLMVATLLFGGFTVFMSQTMLAPAFPAMMNDFGIGATDVQWLASAYTLAMAIIVPANAYLLSRFTASKLFTWANAVFAVGCIVSFAAPTFPAVLVGRIVQGFMAGAIMPTVITSVVTMYPEERRGSATGLIALVISIAPALGPGLSGIIVDFAGWRVLFALLAGLGLVAAAASHWTVRDRIAYERIPLDAPSVVLMGLGMSLLLYGTSSLASSGLPAVSTGCIAAGLVFAVLFVRRQGQLEYPFLKVSVMRSRAFATSCIVMGLTNAVLICTEAVFPLFIQNVLGHSASVSGFAVLPAVLVGLPFAIMSGKIFDKHGIRGVASIGSLLLFAGAVPLLFYAPGTSVVLLTVLFIIMQIGGQLLFAPSQAWGINSLDAQEVPHGSSLFSTFEQLAASFGVAVVMSLTSLPQALGENAATAQMSGVHLGFVACFAIAGLVALTCLVFARDK